MHHNVILIFDGGESEETDIQDTHHEHFRAVCLALKEMDISLSVSGCVFDAREAVGVGFQFERLSAGSVMVVDLMDGQDEDEDDDTEDEDEDEEEIELEDSNGGVHEEKEQEQEQQLSTTTDKGNSV